MRVSKSIRILIVVTAFAILSGATLSATRIQAGEAKDDDEAQAAKDLADRQKKLADEKARKAAEAEAAAAAEKAKKDELANKNKAPAAKVVPVMPQRCVLCQDMKILPNLPFKPYIKFENEPPPNPDYPAAWHVCDKCQKGIDAKASAKEISDDMKARQETARGLHGYFENMLAKKFVMFETPYVTVRSMLPAAANHKVADALEKCAGLLETNSKSMVLMCTHPDKDQIVYIGDEPTYVKLVDNLVKDPKQNDMTKKCAGTGWRDSSDVDTEIIDMGKPNIRPECFGVFDFGGLLIRRATDGKAKPWLVEGFSSYCEHATLNTNTTYRIAYELNPSVKFSGKPWSDEMKKLLKDNKVKRWEELYEIQMEHLKATEYLHCNAIVTFLIKSDAARFDKFVLLVKEGMDAGPAIELAYGKSSNEIQLMWRNWITTWK